GQAAAAVVGVDVDRVGLLDQRPHEVAEHRRRGRRLAPPPTAAGTAAVAAVVVVVELGVLVGERVVVVDGAHDDGVGVVLAAPVNSAQAPESCRIRWTRSVGWAPLRSHSTALALSISTRVGSWRG